LFRVSQLATKLAAEHRRSSIQKVLIDGPVSEALDGSRGSPITQTASTVVSTAPRPPRRRRISRPSTAPSPTGSSSSSSRFFFGDASITSRTLTRIVPDAQTCSTQNNRRLHHKAPSTDSFPTLGVNEPPVSTRLPLPASDPPPELVDDPGKRKKGLFRGILRR
jgi:hypothetical protein